MDMKEKAAYLKGLAEGLNYDKTTAEGKLLTAIIEGLSSRVTAPAISNLPDSKRAASGRTANSGVPM